MAFKTFNLENIGEVTVYKRAGTRSLRLSIRPDGSIRITIPTWSPYAAGVTFARTRADWIRKHARPTPSLLQHGQQIGKSHRLQLVASATASKVSTRIKATEVMVTYPSSLAISSPSVQKPATTASIRALRAQAERLLPIRMRELASAHGFDYKSVSVKQLKTRWGSCDQSKNIVLNLFLMQLPWHLIDYVLLHELTHTQVMQHGPTFWAAMQAVEPKTQTLRKEIKAYQPILSI